MALCQPETEVYIFTRDENNKQLHKSKMSDGYAAEYFYRC